MDNLRMIEILSPLSRRERIRDAPTPTEFKSVQAMERCGIWDSVSLPKRNVQRAFRTCGEMFTDTEYEKDRVPWTDAEWQQLLCVVQQIEYDVRPGGFNQHGLPKLPRCGRDGAPWLWRLDGRSSDVGKLYFHQEFRARLHTMDTKCDSHHTTNESAATLFIKDVVQFYESGGKCHMFGMILTPFVGHVANYSIGRAVFQQVGYGTQKLINQAITRERGALFSSRQTSTSTMT
ncbi:hypothetical protein NX059_012049 [Plenodomus lindquistii]|nr:hypothetical protein NX059_012049 [Plenodomus lindquistii]